jgi:hypothetical protein
MDADKAAHEILFTVLQNDAPQQAVDQLISYLSGTGTSALAALSPENYDERIRGAVYLSMAMPAYQLG